jgi:Rhamnogalacturonan lyase family 11, C-terminal domain/FG-GAP-like repeat
LNRTRTLVSAAIAALFSISVWAAPQTGAGWTQYETNPFVIPLDVPAPEDSAGGIVVADLNGDGLMDYLVTVRGHIAAYAHDGTRLWVRKAEVVVGSSSERDGLPGHHGPGVQAGDISGDGSVEVVFLTRDGLLHVADSATGKDEWTAKPPVPEKAERWEHVIIACFRGKGDSDLLLQATNADGYRVGYMMAAYAFEDLRAGKYEPLWQRDDFLACAHNGARIADLDGDGRDEILGATLLSPDGELAVAIPLRGHVDSIFVRDVRPDLPGLEVVALEEGGKDGNRVFLFNKEKLLWETHYQHWEPQNAAVGEFDPDRPGLEIWCRSRFNKHQKPFVFDANGKLINNYEMDKVAPDGWTFSGVEVIHTIDWTGGPVQFAAAKERHEEGDVCVFNGLTGAFVKRFPDKADRLYVADVSGDWREEMVVLNGSTLHVYHNADPNPNASHPRLWDTPHYRRSKMTHNYYSP